MAKEDPSTETEDCEAKEYGADVSEAETERPDYERYNFNFVTELRVVLLLSVVGCAFWFTSMKPFTDPSLISDSWSASAADPFDHRLEIDARLEGSSFSAMEGEPASSPHKLSFRGILGTSVQNSGSRGLYDIEPKIRIWFIYDGESSVCKFPTEPKGFSYHAVAGGQNYCALGIPAPLEPVSGDWWHYVPLEPGGTVDLHASLSGSLERQRNLTFSNTDIDELNQPKWTLLEVFGDYESRLVTDRFLNRTIGAHYTRTDTWRPVKKGKSCSHPLTRTGVTSSGHNGCPS